MQNTVIVLGRGTSPGCLDFPLEYQSMAVPFTKPGNTSDGAEEEGRIGAELGVMRDCC